MFFYRDLYIRKSLQTQETRLLWSLCFLKEGKTLYSNPSSPKRLISQFHPKGESKLPFQSIDSHVLAIRIRGNEGQEEKQKQDITHFLYKMHYLFIGY